MIDIFARGRPEGQKRAPSKRFRRQKVGPGTSVLRSSSVLMVGSVAAQVIPLVTLPIVTRMYDPAAIGLQALAITWASTLSVIATLRLDLASVLAANERAAERIVHATLTTMLMVIPCIALLLALFDDLILGMIGHSEATFWLWMLPVLSLMMALTQLGSSLQVRQKGFRRLALVNLVNQTSTQSLSLGIGAFSPWLGGLVIARVLGQIAAVVSLWSNGLWAYVKTWKFSLRDLREVLAECRQFAVFNTPYSIVSTVARDAPLIIFGALASATTVGFYGIARAVMFVPTSLASVSLGPVFFKEAVDKIGTPELERVAKRLLAVGMFVPAAGFALVVVVGPEIFALAFGADWRVAGEFAALLAPASWCALQSSWIGRVFEVRGKQRRQFVMQIIADSTVIVAVGGTMILWGDLLVSVALFALLSGVQSLVYFFVAARVASFKLIALARTWAFGAGFFALVVVALVVFETTASSLGIHGVWFSIAFACVATVTVTVFFRRWMTQSS
ncbi:oligosaccharide flippase family protein [Cryobacterium sp. Sr3]|uniref:lipopolysaccharide biosynthesis protein n=1 Tax=Cryobacterium sp. Sr3 TaxID=1259194 RepID=UPI00106D987B|nr:oligosaccharide flippase family protein [Cryobacterium sp. Sr3]TFB55268.1 hypothetical protein E3N94_09900 [Cryobacterium sp. Sr3]